MPSGRGKRGLAGVAATVYANGSDDAFSVEVTHTSAQAGLTLDGSDGTDSVGIFDPSGGAVLRDLTSAISQGVLQVSCPDGILNELLDQNLEQIRGGLPVTPS